MRRTEPDIQTLRAALKNDRSVTLDVAALEIARLEYPDLDPDPYLSALDATAHGVAAVQGRRQDGPSFIAAANLCLFEQLAFRGNEAEYYDPRNSCLNEVLDLKLGIPITLAVVYIEVARRLRRPVFSVGLPGHFIVQYDDDSYSTFIDPFHQGRLLNLDDCAALARDIAGVDISQACEVTRPVSNQYILIRMLNNLRSAYFSAQKHHKALAVLDLLIEASPDVADHYRHRGAALMHMREFIAASRDLATYLQLSPEAPHRQDVVKKIDAIQRWLASVN